MLLAMTTLAAMLETLPAFTGARTMAISMVRPNESSSVPHSAMLPSHTTDLGERWAATEPLAGVDRSDFDWRAKVSVPRAACAPLAHVVQDPTQQ